VALCVDVEAGDGEVEGAAALAVDGAVGALLVEGDEGVEVAALPVEALEVSPGVVVLWVGGERLVEDGGGGLGVAQGAFEEAGGVEEEGEGVLAAGGLGGLLVGERDLWELACEGGEALELGAGVWVGGVFVEGAEPEVKGLFEGAAGLVEGGGAAEEGSARASRARAGSRSCASRIWAQSRRSATRAWGCACAARCWRTSARSSQRASRAARSRRRVMASAISASPWASWSACRRVTKASPGCWRRSRWSSATRQWSEARASGSARSSMRRS
jgi:hypothetical protein